MSNLSINLILNQKEHLKLLVNTIKKYNIDSPVYLIEYDDCISFDMETDYEQYEMIEDFVREFPDFELVEDVNNGQEDILLIISRSRSPFADGWDSRWSEDRNSKSYLVRKRERKVSRPLGYNLVVLFGEDVKKYPLYICTCHQPATGRDGFLVVRDDPEENPDTEIISRLFDTPTAAFFEAHRLKQPEVEKDYQEYQTSKKKTRKRKKKAAKDVQ